MNQHQQNVADIDQRRRVTIRALSMLGAGIVAIMALWSAGLPPSEWLAAAGKWWAEEESSHSGAQSSASAPATPRPASVESGANTPSSAQVRRLRLFATAPGRNSREGTAQIGADGVPQTIAAGGMLENGTILKEIHTDYVLLERDGAQTELYVDGVARNPAVAAKKPDNDSLLMLEQSAQTLPTPPQPPTYTDMVRAAPHYNENAIVGFDVYPGTDRSVFGQLGLQPGDLLMSVDGVTLSSVAALDTVMKDLKEGRAVTATIRRGGQEITLAMERVTAADTALTAIAPP